MRTLSFVLLASLVALVASATAATAMPPLSDLLDDPDPGETDVHEVKQKLEEAAKGAEIPVSSPGTGGGGADEGGDDGSDGAFASGTLATTGLFAFGAAGLAFFGFILASHYSKPKEALENPQRAVLYGFVRGNPGVHLKQLSKEFDMKTSTVLWHIRKLERADLVRSSKANGFRVFYPVEGGVEAKRVSMALTALSNDNARNIFEFISSNPGTRQKGISRSLELNPGTVRWHLRKLREMGLVVEVPQDRNPAFYASELGAKAFNQALGLAGEPVPAGAGVSAPRGVPASQ